MKLKALVRNMVKIKDAAVRHVVYTAIGEVLVDQGQAFMFGFDFDEYLPDEVALLVFNDVRDMNYEYDEKAEEVLLYCLSQASSVSDMSFVIGFSFALYIKRYAKYLKVKGE